MNPHSPTNDPQRNPNPAVPSNDALMMLLASVTETYSWPDFKPILYSPERLAAWLREKLAEPEPDRYLDPEDPAATELSEMSAEAEMAALEFLRELTDEEVEKLETALRAVWGRAGAALMPVRIAQQIRPRRN